VASACLARVGVADRADLTVEAVASNGVPEAHRHGPGSWIVADAGRALVVRSVAAGPTSAPRAGVVFSVVGPRLRQLLHGCGAAVPGVGEARRSTVGTVSVWILVEDIQHALVVVAEGDADTCRRTFETQGEPLGCVTVGAMALWRLAVAGAVTLT
jgi:sarcosine oxidase gamma subunit